MPQAFSSAFLLVRESLTFAKSLSLNSDSACDVRIWSIEPAKNAYSVCSTRPMKNKALQNGTSCRPHILRRVAQKVRHCWSEMTFSGQAAEFHKATF